MAISRKRPLDCPIEVTISALSARWKARLIWQMADGPLSYGALRRQVEGISDRMLNEQLSQLVEDRIVGRQDAAEGPRYQLTELGVVLLPVLEAMFAWGSKSIAGRREAVEPRPPERPATLLCSLQSD
jgi:DNA-binding HxlR family transcriptional regulator